MGQGLPVIDTKSKPVVGTHKKNIDDQVDCCTELLKRLAE